MNEQNSESFRDDKTLSKDQGSVRDQVVDIMNRIAAVVECSAMSDPLFAAWMLGSIHAATNNGLRCRVENALSKSVEQIRDDAERLREHCSYEDSETIRMYIRPPKP